jgi:hypothetical protein
VSDEVLERLATIVSGVEATSGALQVGYQELREVLYPLASNVRDALDRSQFVRVQARPADPPRVRSTTRRSVPEAAADTGASGGANPSSNGSLTNPEQRVLNAIRWYEALGITQPTRIMVGFVAGYRVSKKGGGTFANILSALRNAEPPKIEYPTTGLVALTDVGRALAVDPGIEPTNQGVQAAVMERLDNPEQRVLSNLIAVWPNPMGRIELGEASGYTVTAKGGGTFANILSRLRSLGLIDYPGTGQAVATEVLFPVGARR